MKATLEFSLPEDQREFDDACNVLNYIGVLNALAGELRDKIKYNPPKNKREYSVIDSIYMRLCELAQEYGVEL